MGGSKGFSTEDEDRGIALGEGTELPEPYRGYSPHYTGQEEPRDSKKQMQKEKHVVWLCNALQGSGVIELNRKEKAEKVHISQSISIKEGTWWGWKL